MSEEKKKGIFKPSIVDHRTILAQAKSQLPPEEAVNYLDLLVPTENNVKIPVRIYMPDNLATNQAAPTIFYLPGTAFVASETQFTHVNCSHIARIAQAKVVVIFNRLAPENQFPIGFNDAYQVFKYFISGKVYSIDKTKVGVLGYSSGGNFAALLAIRAQQEGIQLTKQILVSPLVDLSRSLPLFKKIEDEDKDISESFVQWSIDSYLPPNKDRKNPHVSPFWQKSEILAKLPSTDIILSEHDRCYADSAYFYQKLIQAKIDVKLILFPNSNHTFFWQNLAVTKKVGERFKLAFDSYLPELNLKKSNL